MGEGRAALAPLKPRGNAPGTHVVNSVCWEMPACVAPQLGTETQLLFDKIYEADRSRGGVFSEQTVTGEEMANGGCYAVVLLLIMGVMPRETFSLFHGGPSLSIREPTLMPFP